MNKPSNHVTKIISLITIVVGCLAMAGWVFNVTLFTTVFPGWASMKFNTALCFVLSGLSLYLFDTPFISKRRKTVALVCVWIVFLIGFLTISEYIFGYNIHIDELFWKVRPEAGFITFPGRMSQLTASSFALLGIMLLLLQKKRKLWLIQALLYIVAPFSIVTIIIYFFNVPFLKDIPLLSTTALHTSILFILLCLAIFFSLPLHYLEFSFRKKIVFFFVMVSVVLGIIFFAINKNKKQSADTAQRVEHTNKVLLQAEKVKAKADEMQSGVRGYVLTGDENYLPLFINSSDTITDDIRYLRTITKDNRSQQLRIDTLEKLISDYIVSRNELINIRRDKGLGAAQKIVLNGHGEGILNKVRSKINAINQEENQLMVQRKIKNEESVQRSSRIIVFFEILTVLLLLSALIIIYNNSHARDIAEKQLKESEEKYSMLFNSIDQGFCIIEMIFNEKNKPVDYRFLVINASFEKQTGLFDAVGKRMRELAPGHEEHWFEIYGKIALTGESLRFENRAEQLGRWYEVYAFRFGEPKNLQVGILFNDITSRKKAEEALIHTLKEVSEYKNALQNQSQAISSTNAIIEFDKEGNILTANDNFLDLFGYSLSEIKGKHHRILLKEEQVDTNEYKEFWKQLNRGVFQIGEFERKTKNGQTIWILGSYNMIYDLDGRLIKILKIVTDITDRKKTEEVLRKSLKEVSDYKHALDESSIVAITDQRGIIKQVNENFCKISKYTREELIGHDHHIMNSGFHSEEFIQGMWETISNGKVWHGEVKNKAKDGTYYWLDTTIVPFVNEQGRPYQYIAIRSDITKRKILQDEIKQFNSELQSRVEEKTAEVIEKEQQYRFLLQNMREGIQVIGHDWRYLFVNNSVVEQSKYSNEELLGHTMMEKYPGIENTEMFSALQTCMKERISKIIENEFTFPDGTKEWYELSIQPVPEGLFILSMDITVRKKDEEKLREYAAELKSSNKELERFAYVASHDLQEPLRMVSSFLNLLENRIRERLDETSKQYINFAVDGAVRMKTLIQDLLLYSRVGNNKEDFISVDLNEIMLYVVKVLDQNIRETNTEITVKPLPVIFANKTLISQLFVNLVSNAIKYHGEQKTEIEVGCNEDPSQWIFYVKDNGIGINASYFEKIFVIFQRLHNKSDYPGTGIGLAICKKIIEVHRGKIWVESEEGKGSTFYFSIPKTKQII
ncbi:MAG: PAS domain S-box protein [Bacteroidota bacterium]|nr:PAS domain S-box protein [Bacteroidota bacterium]